MQGGGGYPPDPNNPGGYGQNPNNPGGGYGQQGPNAYGGYGPPPPQHGMPQQQFGGPMIPGGRPDAPYGVDPVTGIPFSDKSKIIAGILQLVLGAFGAGRFYTGHTMIAIAQILATWLTCGIGGLWPFVDGIMMLVGKVKDPQGRPLRDGT